MGPPTHTEWQTDTCENITLPQLHLQVVIKEIHEYNVVYVSSFKYEICYYHFSNVQSILNKKKSLDITGKI